MSEQAKKKSGRGFAFLLGAVVGATAAYFLTTDEGKQWRKETARRTGEFSNRVKSLVRDQLDNVGTVIEKGRDMVEDLTDQTPPVEDFSHNAIKTAESSFQRGMRKAKQELEHPRDN